jgi:hypothetical protein
MIIHKSRTIFRSQFLERIPSKLFVQLLCPPAGALTSVNLMQSLGHHKEISQGLPCWNCLGLVVLWIKS